MDNLCVSASTAKSVNSIVPHRSSSMGCTSSSPAPAEPEHFRTIAPSSPDKRASGSDDVVIRRPFALTWEKKEKLGKGQYATVYRVVNKSTGVVAAVKEILKSPLTKEDLEALAVEVKAMELLRDHINFVKCVACRMHAARR